MLQHYSKNMGVLLGFGKPYFGGRTFLLGAVVLGVLLVSGSMPALGQTSPSSPSPANNPDRFPITIDFGDLLVPSQLRQLGPKKLQC